MNEPEITKILEQFSTEEICEAYLGAEFNEQRTWLIECDDWHQMPEKYFIAELFRRVIELEEKIRHAGF